MTRLTSAWLDEMRNSLVVQQQQLMRLTGLDYLALAAKVSGRTRGELACMAGSVRVAAIPVTTGEGLIGQGLGSFAQTVATVTRAMGFESFVTDQNDVAGLHEAYQRGADVLYLADDDRFLALNPNERKLADNDPATAAGYLTILTAMAEQRALPLHQVLILGCGRIGREVLRLLAARGIPAALYDKDPTRAWVLQEEEGFGEVLTEAAMIRHYPLILDATSEGGWLKAQMLHPDLALAAPGVPFSLDQEAANLFSDRFFHDVLPVGVAAMLGIALTE